MAARLGRQEARTVIDAMLQAAIDRKLEFAAAVVDPGGELIAMARTDGASALNVGKIRPPHQRSVTEDPDVVRVRHSRISTSMIGYEMRILSRASPLLLFHIAALVERGRRCRVLSGLDDAAPDRARLGVRVGQVLGHAGLLRALTGKEQQEVCHACARSERSANPR